MAQEVAPGKTGMRFRPAHMQPQTDATDDDSEAHGTPRKSASSRPPTSSQKSGRKRGASAQEVALKASKSTGALATGPPRSALSVGPLRSWIFPAVLTVGSICSGMLTDHFARADAGYPTEMAFWCEMDQHARRFINANVPNVLNFADACSEEFLRQAPAVDVLSAGFPCQPWSQMGDHLGMDDVRGVVIIAIILYMKFRLPRIVILENVRGLLTMHLEFFVALLEHIKGIIDPRSGKAAYSVRWKMLNSKLHGGIPQDRLRVYIVCILNCGKAIARFTWPTEIPAKGLASIFDKGGRQTVKLRTYADYPMPNGAVLRKNLTAAIKRVTELAEADGKNPVGIPAIVDTQATSLALGLNATTTLTNSRGKALAFWSLQHGRPLSVSELMRLQGFDPDELVVNVSPNQMGGLLGNAYTKTVYGRVLGAAVEAARNVAPTV